MDDDAINPNIVCHVCGENEFEQREGFYYCQECGVKQEQVRLVEVENTDAFNETTGVKRQAKTTKINAKKAEQPQVTSWECYNYILRGYVNELMAMGAKEELKLMSLQVWAAYLRRREAAFFSKKHLELPRLGVRYLKNDAQTIYNHRQQARKKRKRKKNGDGTSGVGTGQETSNVDWRKNKRKLDESLYSSLTSNTSASMLSTSNASAATNRAIRLNFSMKARKLLKRKMSSRHLARHETDDEGILQCHNRPKVSEIGRINQQLNVMSIKQIYAVLGIALNLIGDDIQLCDLVRFINEGHIGWKNVLSYFPENIAMHSKELLRKIDFYKYPEKYSEKFMRDHISLLCGDLHIHKFKMPNMVDLVRRYVTELCLPQDIAVFAERLMNLLPPSFESRTKHIYPYYEARAMAYIVFILKLLFGLDGQKEHRMSSAAVELNYKIQELNKKNNESRPLLFVWNEWVEYIQMRKIIVSHFNPAFCRQFKLCESEEQIMEQMSKGIQQREEEKQNLNEPEESPYYKQQYETFRSFLNTMLEQQEITDKPINLTIEFKQTLTPAFSYFETIRMNCDSADNNGYVALTGGYKSYKIPDFMRVNHGDRDMRAYVEVKSLVDYFENHQQELKVFSLETTENRVNVGIFRFVRSGMFYQTMQRPKFDIQDEEWAEYIKNRPNLATDDLEWKTSFDVYEEKYFRRRLRKSRRQQSLNTTKERSNSNIAVGEDVKSFLPSIEVFTENNMDPLETDNAPAQPRRDLDKFNIFDGIYDEEYLIRHQCDEVSSENDTASNKSDDTTVITLNSSMESIHIKSEFLDNSFDDTEIKTEFFEEPERPTNKKRKHKFYVSNMDCWMLLGHVSSLCKSQRAEVLEKFPTIFKWLIETCAQTLGVKWIEVYEQLLAIEVMFGMGVEDLDKLENCVYLNYLNPIKDIQMLIDTYREIW